MYTLQLLKTFLFQAIQFSQTVLIQTIQFRISIDFVHTQSTQFISIWLRYNAIFGISIFAFINQFEFWNALQTTIFDLLLSFFHQTFHSI